MATGDVSTSPKHYPYVVIGGGIAGVSCAETLSLLCKEQPEKKILLLIASPLVKAVTNFRKVTRALEDFDVEERPMFDFAAQCTNVVVKQEQVSALLSEQKLVRTSSGTEYTYDRLCICTGGSPKVISKDNPHVLGIRDTETVKVFQQKLSNARRVVVVGNGGIATELIFEIDGCEVVWAIKDKAINSTFVDAGAAQFLLPRLHQDNPTSQGPKKRTKYIVQEESSGEPTAASQGSALGPDWHEGLPLHGQQECRQVHIEYGVEVDCLLTGLEVATRGLTPHEIDAVTAENCKQAESETPGQQKLAQHTPKSTKHAIDWPVYVQLTSGKLYGCDFVVSATGVTSNTEVFTSNNKFDLSSEGRLNVDATMQTNIKGVYAAGDVCTANWELSTYWIQMCLWSQARQMGTQAARCMVAHEAGEEDAPLDFCFEMFAHVTKFFNYKVVLLGKFNAQGLGDDYSLLIRRTKGVEYVKVVLKDGRMHGAVLIGDTDLEETFENLILNQMDLSAFGEDLLDPNIDIEDFFD